MAGSVDDAQFDRLVRSLGPGNPVADVVVQRHFKGDDTSMGLGSPSDVAALVTDGLSNGPAWLGALSGWSLAAGTIASGVTSAHGHQYGDA